MIFFIVGTLCVAVALSELAIYSATGNGIVLSFAIMSLVIGCLNFWVVLRPNRRRGRHE